jgi:plastocyanin
MSTRQRIAALALLPVAFLAACGSSSGGDGATSKTTAGGAPSGLTIKSFAFSPKPLTVKAGAEVTVKNEDSTNHTVTADDGSFDTKGFQGTKTFTAPDKPGTYAFHCDIHDYMKGVIQVDG